MYNNNFITKRFYILVSIILVLNIALFFRLFQKQILEHDELIALAKKQYLVEESLPSPRGKIYIKDYYTGEDYLPIATNITFYSVEAIPKNITDVKKVAKKLAPLIDLNEKEIYKKINNDKIYIPPLQKKVDKKIAHKIEELDLKGVLLVPALYRYYPESELASQVLGYVDADSNGQYGIEGYYDSELRGKNNTFYNKQDTFGKYIDIIGSRQIESGDDLYLTIDRNIQFIVEEKLKAAIEKLGASGGSVIVMDPKTGAIMAMANYPSFDPNNYSKVKSVDVFNNLSINAIYEPGSVFKPFVVAGALQEDKVEPETSGVFGSCIKIGGYEVCTSTGDAYGRETVGQILEHSDNVGMVFVGREMGRDNLSKYISRFGFRDRTGIDLMSETHSKVLDFEEWREINFANMTFGQGIAISPLQLVSAMSAIANGGKLYQPYVVDHINNENKIKNQTKIKEIRQVISPKVAEDVREMLVGAVERGFGKAAQVSGFSIAGKTGTAQIPNPDAKGYLEKTNIVSFLGFAPAENPQFTILVKLDSPKGLPWAESTAAPVFGDIAKWMLSYLQIMPSK
ncbi:peptidoglycan D,D-transpeptidase FtsI family protein [Patescibacteria group bacterium]